MKRAFASLIFAVLALTLLIGCTVGPSYHRPAVQIPPTFRAPEPLPPYEPASLADLKWWEVFKDDKLQQLIRTALVQNYDLREAVTRVEEARANLTITRSNQFPQLGAEGDVTATRISRNGSLPLPASVVPSQSRAFGEASLNLLSFEVDIWGRLRRATEGARANLLGAEENRKAVITTLVSDVATSYFSLRQLDSELEISEGTLSSRIESLRLIHLGSQAVSPRCSIFGRGRNWSTKPPKPSRLFSNRPSRPRTRSAYYWEKILAR